MLLSVWLESAGHRVFQHTGDADRVVVERALKLAQNANALVHAYDTDILVLLLYGLNNASIYHSNFLRQKKQNRTIYLNTSSDVMPGTKLENLLLCHTMSGCDTTSGFFGIGKCKLLKQGILDECDSNIFMEKDADIDSLVDVGEKILIKLYGKSKCTSLDELRGLI